MKRPPPGPGTNDYPGDASATRIPTGPYRACRSIRCLRHRCPHQLTHRQCRPAQRLCPLQQSGWGTSPHLGLARLHPAQMPAVPVLRPYRCPTAAWSPVRPRWSGSPTNRLPLANSAKDRTWKTHGDDACPGGTGNAARFVAERAERSDWNLPATDINPSTEGTRAGLGQSDPHMATGLPHPWYIRPVAEPSQPGRNSRWARDLWDAAVNAACNIVRARCHDRETTSWRSRSQAHGHVRRTRQDGGGAALRLEFQGEANQSHPWRAKQLEQPDPWQKPDLVDPHPTSPNRTQPVSGCQRLGSCEPTRSTGISARHVESAMILAGSPRSA